MIRGVIADGRDGVALAALTAARRLGLKTGGFAPGGVTVLTAYDVVESPDPDIVATCELNMLLSTGTLLLGQPTSLLNQIEQMAKVEGRPRLWLKELESQNTPCHFRLWAERNKISLLYVCGPREKQAPGFSLAVERFLWDVLPLCK